MAALPRPTGPYAVGTVTCTLIDESRPAHLLSAQPGRKVFVKLWYPAQASTDEAEPLWAELRDLPDTPVILRALMWWLRHKTANAVPAAPYAGPETPKLALYHHGLVSFAAENTSLAEDLASQGFMVMALEHKEQMAELQALNRSRSQQQRETDAARQKALHKTSGPERAALARESYELAVNTNRIVAARSDDTAFVLAHLKDCLSHIPGLGGAIPDDDIMLAGLSLGGAVAMDYAKRESRVRAVANLDGGLYGTRMGEPLTRPCLMIYSSANAGLNDDLLPGDATCLALPGTKHLNFHDIAALMPVLRLVGLTGKARARAVIKERNRLVRDFLMKHSA